MYILKVRFKTCLEVGKEYGEKDNEINWLESMEEDLAGKVVHVICQPHSGGFKTYFTEGKDNWYVTEDMFDVIEERNDKVGELKLEIEKLKRRICELEEDVAFYSFREM